MKVKLLKKLRKEGRSKINILSVTKTNGIITGMSIGYDEKVYSGLFELGDTEDVVKAKAASLYIILNIEAIRKKYSKYSKHSKLNNFKK